MDRLELRTDGRCVVVVGEIDASTAAALRDAMTDCGTSPRIDLSGCTFIDSSGITALVDANNTTDQDGGQLTLVAPSKPVVQLIDICGLTEILHTEPAPNP